MVSSGLRKVSKKTEACIFCSLRISASRLKRPPLWRTLHTTSNPRRPSASVAAVQEEEEVESQRFQRSQWVPRQPSDLQQNSVRSNATLSPIATPPRSTTEAPRVPWGSPHSEARSNKLRFRNEYARSSSWSQNSRPNPQEKPQPQLSEWSQLPRKTQSDDWSTKLRQPKPPRNEFVSLTGAQEGGDYQAWRPLKSRQPQSSYIQPSRKPVAPPWTYSDGSQSRSLDAQKESVTTSESSDLLGDLPADLPVRTFSEDADRSPKSSPHKKFNREASRRSRHEDLFDDSRDPGDIGANRKKSRQRQNRRLDARDEEGRFYEEDEDRAYSREQKKERKRLRKHEKAQGKSSGNQIILPEFISIGTLATALRVRVEDFANKLTSLGFEAFGQNYVIDGETAGLIASEFGFDSIVPNKDSEHDLVALPPPDDTSLLVPRPPVITIMGHVDHGKTTLLDWLRKSSVAASEHGGITQHIGAFTVEMPSGRIITFLDTPGHAAFLDMRARGANVTDIVILVVAADDSVKPQTIEAIKHAKDAKVPIIVAVNKMDKEDAEPERVKQDLARHGVEVEDFGGETQTVCVSGKTGLGMEELEESAIALADILDVRADITGQVEGWVIEAAAKNSGKVATVLVKRGTLSVGDVIVAGQTWSRVRTLRNEAGVLVESAGPGTPVEVDGWREQPDAGAEVIQAPDEQRARRAVAVRVEKTETEKLAQDVLVLNEARRVQEADRERQKALESGKLEPKVEEEPSTSAQPGLTEVPFVLRADVSGSVEALQASVLALGNSEVRPVILRSAFGPLSPTDIELAATAGGHVISFNQPVDGAIKRMAERSGVRILDESIIYRVTDEIKTVLEEKLPPLITSRVTGEAEIAQVFDITLKGRKKMPVAGCKVRNGNIIKGSKVKVLREKEVLYDGLLTSLKNQKKDVNEMRKGTECGLAFEAFDSFQPGDQVQCYETKEEKRKL